MRTLSASDKLILSLLHLATWISAIVGIGSIAVSVYFLSQADFWNIVRFVPTAIVAFAQGVVFRYVRIRLTDDLTRS